MESLGLGKPWEKVCEEFLMYRRRGNGKVNIMNLGLEMIRKHDMQLKIMEEK